MPAKMSTFKAKFNTASKVETCTNTFLNSVSSLIKNKH